MPLSSGITRVIRGGTGVSTLGDAGVLIGNGTGAVQVTGAGTSGQVLTSNGAGVDPTFQAAAGGITTLNTLTDATQTFAVGTACTDFAISSAAGAHTFNIPDASATARGLVTTGAQTIRGVKTLDSNVIFDDAATSSASDLTANVILRIGDM